MMLRAFMRDGYGALGKAFAMSRRHTYCCTPLLASSAHIAMAWPVVVRPSHPLAWFGEGFIFRSVFIACIFGRFVTTTAIAVSEVIAISITEQKNDVMDSPRTPMDVYFA